MDVRSRAQVHSDRLKPSHVAHELRKSTYRHALFGTSHESWQLPLKSGVRCSHLAAAIFIALLFSQSATAATITVPNGTNLNTLTPVNGDTWTLLGNAYLSNGASASFAKALPANLTFTINGASTGSTVTLNDGAGHYGYLSAGSATLNLSNVTFTGGNNNAGSGGAIYATGSLTLNTSGTVAFNGNATSTAASKYGGAIYAGAGLTVNGGLTANNNVASIGSGAAIYVNTGNLTVSGSTTLSGNIGGTTTTSYPGGAINTPNGGIYLATTSGDAVLTNNSATSSGGVAYVGGNGTTYPAANVSIGNSGGTVTITGNKAGYNGVSGIYVNTTASGGAIYATLNNGVTTLTGSTVTLSNNTAPGSGGGIYSASTVVNGSLIANNNVATNGFGGAIYAGAGNVTVSGGASMNGNVAGAGGGAAVNVNGSLSMGTTSGDVALTNNVGSSSGGAVYATTTGNILLGNTAGTVLIAGNKGGFDAAGNAKNTSSNGGAIYNVGTVTLTGTSVEISGNTATAGAGGIYSSKALTVNGNLIANSNVARNGAGGALSVVAGGVTVTGNASASGNTALKGAGGALYSSTNGVSIGGTLMASNNTAGTDGGAVYTGSSITLGAGTSWLLNNTTTGTGGALYASQGITVMGNLVANGNTTTNGGGGAAFVASNGVTVNGDTQMTGNVSGNSVGGAIYAANGNVTLAGSSGNVLLSQNTAAIHGGAVFTATGSVMLGNGEGTLTLLGNRAGYKTNGGVANAFANGGAISSSGSTTLSGTAVTLSGNTATLNGGAIYAGNATLSGAALTLQNNTASTGNGGAVYTGQAITLNSSGSSLISGNAAGGQGGALWSGGGVTLNATGGSLTFSGNSAGGLGGAIYLDPTVLTLNASGGDIIFSGNTQNTAGAAHANAIYVGNVNGDSSVVLNADAGHSITFYDPIQNDGTKGLITVTKTGAGLVSFDGSNNTAVLDRWSQVYANTEVQAGTFEVANAAAYGVRAANINVNGTTPSTFTVDSGATLQGGVFGAIVADQVTFQNGSVINLAGRQPGVRSVFGIDAANVQFVPGSTVLFNTVLNDATVQDSDRLLLSRATTSGTAAIVVNNVGGSGGLTLGDGIQLVATINGATTNPDSFVLGQRVAAGPFEYELFRGGSVNGDDWFLRNTLTPPPVPPAPPSPPGPPGPPVPPDPPAPPYPPLPPAPPGPPLPNYRPEVPVDMAVPALAIQLGLDMLGTYHDRQGEDYAGLGPTDNSGFNPSAGWGRVFGGSNSVGYGAHDAYDHYNRFSTYGPSYRYDTYGFQTGLDLYRADDSGLRTMSGLYIGANRASGDVKNVYDGTEAGTVDMNGYTLGGYWTRKGASGWYVDTVLQATRYDNIKARSVFGLEMKTTGWGLAASLEGGHPYAIGQQWSLEPQGQLIYQRVSLNDVRDAYAQIQYNGSNALYGRLGLRLVHGGTWGNDYPLTSWARINFWDVLGPAPKTTFATLDGFTAYPFQTSLGGRWAEAQFGMSGQICAQVSLFGSVDYNHVIGVGNGHGVGGRMGVRVVW